MKIDVTGIDLIQFIKEVYKLSVPAGLGYLHFRKGELTNEEAKEHFLPIMYGNGEKALSRGIILWANGATDHLYEIEAPSNALFIRISVVISGLTKDCHKLFFGKNFVKSMKAFIYKGFSDFCRRN